MTLLSSLDLESLSPSRLWSQLDPATREEAIRAAYADGSRGGKIEADMAIARALRFRPTAVRQLPLARRVGYLLKHVPVDDNLASTLLLALHLECRAGLLGSFLDELGVPNEGGLIDEGHELEAPAAETLARAASHAYAGHDAAHVDVYFAALLALDPVTWGGLREIVAARAAG